MKSLKPPKREHHKPTSLMYMYVHKFLPCPLPILEKLPHRNERQPGKQRLTQKFQGPPSDRRHRQTRIHFFHG